MPAFLVTEGRLLHELRALPERAHRGTWVAENGLEVVGWAEAEFEWATETDDVAWAWAGVRADQRGRGVGRRLWDRAEAHVLAEGARELRTGVGDDPNGVRFVLARGFRHARAERLSAVDPRAADLSELSELQRTLEQQGFTLARLADVRERIRDLHALYVEGAADVPADHAQTNIGYDEFIAETLGDPRLSNEGSVVIFHGDRPVSLAWLVVDLERNRAGNELTATVREYRCRGLARLAKLATIRWCAEQGIERVVTGNDSTNEPMLALNISLGYRPLFTWNEYVR